MGSVGMNNVFSLVAMCVLVAAFAMSIIKGSEISYTVASLTLLGHMVIYIVIVVGIFSKPVDKRLVQFWDIIGFGACLGLGLGWIMVYRNMNDNTLFPFISGVLSTVAAVFLLLDAIFCNK
uniref:Uncharacterized protein n=1 Tax=Lygus hesperus TaxID=30085 RepID=A0A0K8SEX4_LYGHE